MRAKRLYGGPRVCTDRTENVCIGPYGGAPPGTEVIYLAETNHTPQSAGPGRRRRKRAAGAEIALNTLKVLGTLLLIGITTGAILACFAAVYIKTVIMPQAPLDLTKFSVDLSTTIYYTDPNTGADVEWLTVHGDENRKWVSYADIPENLVHAAVAIEDKRFYDHHGVDWLRTARGVLTMFTGGDIQGGSTITQQLIKNVTEQDEVTVKRKILEIFRALDFDRNHSKEETLEWYLNYIYLGENCRGVYTASYEYFGKDVSELTLAECASLIGITNNPSIYDPYLDLIITDPETGEKVTNVQRNKNRQENILYQMLDQGYISQEEYDAAVAQELVFVRGEDTSKPKVVYTWFQDQVIRDVIQDLVDSGNGWSEEYVKQMFYSGGLSVYTTFDPKAQAAVDSVYENLDNLPYISNDGQQLQSAIVVIDNATGNVAALSGGMGEKESSLIFNRATQAVRPSGSSIKPLSVYGPAIDMGLITPATVIDDSPYNNSRAGGWPINTPAGYRGLTMVSDALKRSVNTVAVKIMANYSSPELAYQYLTGENGFGITTLVESKEINGQTYSDIDIAPLALGGLTNGVTVREMAAAYSAFPRNGMYIESRTYTKVLDSNGEVLLDNQPETHTVLKESTAWYMNTMLQSVMTSGGTGSSGRFDGMSMAGKTGTTSSRKDLWFAGYTPYYTAVVWTGYDQQERLGSSLNNPSIGLWRKVMSQLHEGLENRSFAKPESVQTVTVQVCKDSGMKATEYCNKDIRTVTGQGERVVSVTLAAGDAPTEFCTYHVPITICSNSPIKDAEGNSTGVFHLAGPYCPEESQMEVSVVDFPRRENLNAAGIGAVSVSDNIFLKEYLDNLGQAAYCDLHTTQPVAPETPKVVDPRDPATWPGPEDYPTVEEWEKFDPYDPATWPAGWTEAGSGGGSGETVPPTELPTEAPVLPEGPDDSEPYVPAA